jgi:zinc transport system ATP-binding protein
MPISDDADAATPLIQTRGLKVRLGNSMVLRGVDLSVQQGEVVALLGVNGSGKSTLVRALLGIVPTTAGTATVPPADRIGYVPQRVSAAGGIPATAQEVVASGLLGKGRLRLPRGWREKVHDALAAVGLEDRCFDATNHLSGGQQQRVLIARALVRAPDSLILDEPVAGVDHASQIQFAETMRGLVASGRTVVVVLHELGQLASLVTRAVVLRHGVIAYDGKPPQAHGDHAQPNHEHLHPHEAPPMTPEGSGESGFAAIGDATSAITYHGGTTGGRGSVPRTVGAP